MTSTPTDKAQMSADDVPMPVMEILHKQVLTPLCTHHVMGYTIAQLTSYRDACVSAVTKTLIAERDALIEDNRAMQSRLSALANHCRRIYDIVPMLPIDESSMEGATDALHAFCLMIGVNGIDIDSARTPTPTTKENDQ